MAKPNREILTGGKRYADKKSKKNRVNEITFDKNSRVEYLTGFHKRKLERKKKAKEYNEEQERKAKLEERKQIREERKEQVQKRLRELNESRRITGIASADEEEDSQSSDEEDNDEKKNGQDSDVDDSWKGFSESSSQEAADREKKGILKQVYQVDDIDAPVTGVSEVVIEDMENPDAIEITKLAELNHVNLASSKDVLDKSIQRAKEYARLVGVDEKKPKKAPVKKKKFRYLSKTERKIKNMKEKQSSLKKRKKKD